MQATLKLEDFAVLLLYNFKRDSALAVKFIYSEKATKFCEISTVYLSYRTAYVLPVKSKVEISQYFVAFSEYMNFTANLTETFR